MTGMNITRINHVAYPISDRGKTLPFYRDVLGLAVIPSMVDNENVIWTQMADGTMVHPIEPPPGGGSAGFHVAFQVDDIDAARAIIDHAGIEVTAEGERHDGQRYFFVFDPDGNRVEVATGNDRKPNQRVTDEWGVTTDGGSGSKRHAPDAPIRVQAVEHVGLPVTDRRRAITFYRDVLGLRIIPSMVDSDSITWLGLANGSMVHLIEPRPDGSSAGHHAGFEVPDYGGALAALAAIGIAEPRQGERHDGRMAVHFADPDGNHVELVSNEEPRTGHRVADEWGYTKAI